MKNILLMPLSFIYGLIVNLRNLAYDKGYLPICRSALPVISIGNVSAGGNAKTPTCIFLAEELGNRGFKPVVLLRGYGGTQSGPHLVEIDSNPLSVGDEALLLKKTLKMPVVIAKDRVAGARFIEKQNLGNVIILDDGLQHRRLFRDIDIVSVNIATEEAIEDYLQAKLLPIGLFRESRAKALRRAHIIIFSERHVGKGKEQLDQRLLQTIPQNMQVYRSFFEVTAIKSLVDGAPLKDKKVVAFCGIANPEGFIKTLQASNLEVASFKTFPDHHYFSLKDLESIRSEFPHLPLVCTSKDAVKLGDGTSGVYECSGKLKVVPSDAFTSQIIKALSKRES